MATLWDLTCKSFSELTNVEQLELVRKIRGERRAVSEKKPRKTTRPKLSAAKQKILASELAGLTLEQLIALSELMDEDDCETTEE